MAPNEIKITFGEEEKTFIVDGPVSLNDITKIKVKKDPEQDSQEIKLTELVDIDSSSEFETPEIDGAVDLRKLQLLKTTTVEAEELEPERNHAPSYVQKSILSYCQPKSIAAKRSSESTAVESTKKKVKVEPCCSKTLTSTKIDTPSQKTGRFDHLWLKENILLQEDVEESDDDDEDFGTSPKTSMLGKVMIAIKAKTAKISYNGGDEELDQSQEFALEMKRWEDHEKKYKNSKDFNRFRPLEITSKNKPVYMKYCNGTIAVSTFIKKATVKNGRKTDFVRFHATKCPQCWRTAMNYKPCDNHSSSGVKNQAVVNDSENKRRDVIGTISTKCRTNTLDCNKEMHSNRSQRIMRVKQYIEERSAKGKVPKFVPIRQWHVKASKNIQERFASVLHSLNVSAGLISTLRNLLRDAGRNKHKRVIFLKTQYLMKRRDKKKVLKLLQKNGINVAAGEKSKLRLEVDSPLVPNTFDKRLPYVYIGFKNNGELYIGVNTSSFSQARENFSSKTHHGGSKLGNANNRGGAFSRGVDADKTLELNDKPLYQLQMTEDDVKIISNLPQHKPRNQYTEAEEALVKKMEIAAYEFETIAIVAVLLGEMLNMKIDQHTVSLCNEMVSNHVNYFQKDDLEKLEKLFEFFFGFKLNVTDLCTTLDFSELDDLA